MADAYIETKKAPGADGVSQLNYLFGLFAEEAR